MNATIQTLSGEEQALQATFGAYELLQLAGLSAIIGGAASAVVNYFLTAKESKKQRQANFIKDKLSIYSYFIFHIEKMRFKGEAIKERDGQLSDTEDHYLFTAQEVKETTEAIDSKIQDQLYLLSYEILHEWVHVKTLMYHPLSQKHIDNLRSLLLTEYNEEIVPLYDKVVGGKLKKLEEP
jgi:hypothetical protein